MTENILVGKLYEIQDHTKWYDDRSAEIGLVDNYHTMAELMVASANNHLVGVDQAQIHRGTAADIREVFYTHFYEIYNLWKNGGVNILYCDLDVVFLKDIEFFNTTDVFSMYNFTDPTTVYDEHYDVNLEHYFNCGVRYYPANMDESVWQRGIKMVENWNSEVWDAEQVIYNVMMWEQGVKLLDVYQPQASWQMLHPLPLSMTNTKFNGGVRVNQAQVAHVHGSRGSESRLTAMRDLAAGRFGEETILL
jgi:hypothetical protein